MRAGGAGLPLHAIHERDVVDHQEELRPLAFGESLPRGCAAILERRERPEMARLYEAIQEDKQSIFPPMFFRKMPAMMEERVEANQRGGELERKMGWLSALWKARPRVAPRVMPAKRTA